MKTKVTQFNSKKFESFSAINEEILKQTFGGGDDPSNPPPEDGSDEDNLHNDYDLKKIIW